MHFNGSVGSAVCTGLIALCLGIPAQHASGQYLYDARQGTFPESQGWAYGSLGFVTRGVSGDLLFQDTTAVNSTQAGWSYVSAIPWSRTNGFTLLFEAQVNSETHVSADRAGFSLIVLGADAHGIELGFWADKIFAQADSPLFTHAEDVAFPTTNSLVSYSLTMLATNYTLRANGSTILTGRVRDYTAFNGFPNPYRTPNLIFFGDDTTSANASVNVRQFVMLLPPVLTMPLPGVVAWTGVSNQVYHVEASLNLVDWTPAGDVTSPDNSFRFTNSLPGFLRVKFP